VENENLSPKNCDFKKFVVSDIWYSIIPNFKGGSILTNKLNKALSSLNKQQQKQNFIRPFNLLLGQEAQTNQVIEEPIIFGSLTKEILDCEQNVLETIETKILTKNASVFEQIYNKEKRKEGSNFKKIRDWKAKYATNPTKCFGKRANDEVDGFMLPKETYYVAPHLTALDETFSNLDRELSSDRFIFQIRFSTFFQPPSEYETGSIKIMRKMNAKSIGDFIHKDNRYGFSVQDKAKLKENVCRFVLKFYEKGAPKKSDIGYQARTNLYQLSKQYQTSTLRETNKATRKLVKEQKREILEDPFIAKLFYKVIESEHKTYLKLCQDYERVGILLNEAKTKSRKISKTACDYLEFQLKNFDVIKQPQKYERLLIYTALLGSPGIDLELGELQFWNVLEFFNNLNGLKETNLYRQALLKIDKGFYINHFKDEVSIAQLCNFDLPLPRIKQ